MDPQHHGKFFNSSSLLVFLLSHFFTNPMSIPCLNSSSFAASFPSKSGTCTTYHHYSDHSFFHQTQWSLFIERLDRFCRAPVWILFRSLALEDPIRCILFGKSRVFSYTLILKLAACYYYKLFNLVRGVCIIGRSYKMQNSLNDEVEWVSLQSNLNFL